jgi:hypothetical protein
MSFSFKSNKLDPTYREVMKLPPFEVCKMLKFSTENFFLKQMITAINEAAPGLLRCPIKGVKEVRNFTIPHKYFQFMPSGFYQCRSQLLLTENGKSISNFLLEFQLKNGMKDMLRK